MPLAELIAVLLLTAILIVALGRLRMKRWEAWLLPPLSAAIYLCLRLTVLQPRQAAATAIFALAYALIASERVHKTKAALGGAVAMLLTGLVPQATAFHGTGAVSGIDWNTIFLLIGMMIIVNITRQTGLFQWLAIRAAKIAHGDPLAVLVLLALITAVLSAALDNVTTVLLIAPVAILLAERLRVNVMPYLICIILASNIGGTATLIGDPPNILIGSAAGFRFGTFLRINGPVSLLSLLLLIATMWLTVGRRLPGRGHKDLGLADLDEHEAIRDPRLLRRAVLVIALTLAGFGLHGVLHLQPATIALAGAALMLFFHHEGPEQALQEIEWATLFFFIGLFIMVSALVDNGVIGLMGEGLLTLTRGNPVAMTFLVLWFSGLASGVVDNIPLVATMTALIQRMALQLHPEAATVQAASQAPEILPLWWALSLGACLGGNLTLVGASANVIVAGVAERHGRQMNFLRFMRYGVPVTLQGLLLSSVWLWLMFLR